MAIPAHTAVPAHEATLLGFNSEGWVYWGLTIFLLLMIIVAKAPKRIASALDDRIATTRRTLDEARAVRAEAEALLAEAKTTRNAAASDAAAMLAHAEAEARQLVEKAKGDAETLIARREQIADDRIAAAERQAIDEVRAAAAALAAAAAGKLITERHDAAADKTLVDRTIAGLGQRAH